MRTKATPVAAGARRHARMGSMLRQAALLHQYYLVLAGRRTGRQDHRNSGAQDAGHRSSGVQGNGLRGVLSERAVKSDNPDVTSGWGMESAPTPVGPVHPAVRHQRWGRWRPAATALVVCLLLTASAWQIVARQVERAEAGVFQQRTDRVLTTMRGRLASAKQAVYGARALLDGQSERDTGDWEQYVRSVEPFLNEGVVGLGRVERIPALASRRSSSGSAVMDCRPSRWNAPATTRGSTS